MLPEKKPVAIHAAAVSYSRLWGKAGERWDTTHIPDFIGAGYKSGMAPIPEFPTGVNVTDFGAIGDGMSDNTEAFRQAIAACGPHKAVFIPPGTYLLSDTLQIKKSNICLTGKREDPAVLYFSKGIENLYPLYNRTGNKKTIWSWSGAMILFTGRASNAGIANLKIAFPDSAWAGHNFHERGYNGIGFANGVHDAWIKNVTITGADVGIWIGSKAHHITAEDWVLDFGTARGAKRRNGHHGVVVYGSSNLFQDFKIKGRFQHDITVTMSNAVYNVFRSGAGQDLSIDHHSHNTFKNLFTNLHAGAGTRLYESGGQAPRGVCFQETFWNITAAAEMGYPDEMDDFFVHSGKNVCVGIKTKRASVLGDRYGNWFETIDPDKLRPKDLYLAQRARLNKTMVR
jgi:hypothetical protein